MQWLGRPDQRHRGPAGAARGLAHAARALLLVDGVDAVAAVHEVLDRMAAFSERVRRASGVARLAPIRNVVNIGIGGSDLGPVMAYRALRFYARRDLVFRFVSNVDSTDFAEATRDLDPEETLFIVSSKTFTTFETMTNARTAREWLRATPDDEAAIAKHFVAVSTNAEQVGVRHRPREHVPVLGLGRRATRWNRRSGLDHDRDRAERFAEPSLAPRARRASGTTPLERNLPVLLGLLAVWYADFFGAETYGVMPYCQYLERFPAYLQQLAMESNGKRSRSTAGRSTTTPAPWSGASPGRTASTASSS